jgi:predicted amidohydrolase
MRVGFWQFDVEFGQVERNLARVADALAEADADLIVLPEFFATGYLFTSRGELAELAEPYPGGRTMRTLSQIAAEREMTIVAGFAERDGDAFYNSAAVIGPDGPCGLYRKVHLFNDEKLHFSPGGGPLPIIDVAGVKVGVMICFDWYFPEAARTLAIKGAQVICHPSNLVLPWCPDAMPIRALENRVFTVTCNRIGVDIRGDKRLSFIGQSIIAGPDGRTIHRASPDQAELFVADIDPAEALDKAITRRNDALADRRPDVYELR